MILKQSNNWIFYYKEIFDNIKLLDKLNTILNKNILYNLLRFTSFKNKNPDLLECLHFLDSKLYQTEALDGFYWIIWNLFIIILVIKILLL